MKIHATILALIAISSTAMAAEKNTPVQMDPECDTVIRSAVASLSSGSIEIDDKGNVTIDKEDLAAVKISHVKVISSSCQGPADCDDQNPDQFTYSADIGKKGEGLTGKVVASYHRGNCFVQKISLK